MTNPISGFQALHLISPLLKNLQREGYVTPTPVQEKAIPCLLEGKDVLVCAQTGTGKTAAFALPILQKLFASEEVKTEKGRPKKAIKALILAPTRELAVQIGESFRTYGNGLGVTHTVICGGVGYRAQIQKVTSGVDILVATPGRLMDLMNQKIVSLHQVEIFVLDEADQMFDKGFGEAVQRISAVLPSSRQTILFSATMPPSIAKLANSILENPTKIIVAIDTSTAKRIKQQVLFVAQRHKPAALVKFLSADGVDRSIVFSRTKHGADRIVELLADAHIEAEAIHGDKKQGARRRILQNFKQGKCTVLVATDVAARGIDIEGVTHVFNYDLPPVAETYVHRIGRTGRAGAEGIAISFCTSSEKGDLKNIEHLTKTSLEVLKNSDFDLPLGEEKTKKDEPKRQFSRKAPRKFDRDKRDNRSQPPKKDHRKSSRPQKKKRERGA